MHSPSLSAAARIAVARLAAPQAANRRRGGGRRGGRRRGGPAARPPVGELRVQVEEAEIRGLLGGLNKK